jgi:hypothetical protein
MENQITQKFIDLLGPITDGKLHFSKYAQENVAGGHTVCEMSKVQLQLAEQLIKDHFKVKKVLWMEMPTGLTEDGKETIVAKTHKLTDSDYKTYEGKTAYIYQILFSPIMYDPSTWAKEPVKDGCTFSPLWFDPLTFTPSRRIVLSFNPTFPQDIDSTVDQEEVMKQSLRDKLEQVLTNPKDYMPEGFRACLLRFAAK